LRLDHIGIVVESLGAASKDFQRLHGFKPLTGRIHEPAHEVEILFLEIGHGQMPMVELIRPLSKKSKVSNFLEKNGGGIHHLAYEVDDIHESIQSFKKEGSIVLGGIVPGAGHSNLPTVWIYLPDKSLVELIQKGHHEL
jgi:methylmalonyl-CoA/ethylmalonyl-CoA epimerase